MFVTVFAHIILPTPITTTAKTLVDNIYSNCTNFSDDISGNVALAISDHLAQFLIIKEVTDKIPVINNIYKRETLAMEIWT